VARLHARGLELDARGASTVARAMRDDVLDELTELAARATGEIPADDAAGGAVPRALAHRIRDRMARDVEAALEPMAAVDGARLPPLEAWDRWLTLRSVLDDFERRAGRTALTMLWHGRVRDIVWAWACALFNEQPVRTAWVAHMIFAWLADRAEYIGDLGATLINRENARIALATCR